MACEGDIITIIVIIIIIIIIITTIIVIIIKAEDCIPSGVLLFEL